MGTLSYDTLSYRCGDRHQLHVHLRIAILAGATHLDALVYGMGTLSYGTLSYHERISVNYMFICYGCAFYDVRYASYFFDGALHYLRYGTLCYIAAYLLAATSSRASPLV